MYFDSACNHSSCQSYGTVATMAWAGEKSIFDSSKFRNPSTDSVENRIQELCAGYTILRIEVGSDTTTWVVWANIKMTQSGCLFVFMPSLQREYYVFILSVPLSVQMSVAGQHRFARTPNCAGVGQPCWLR